MARKEAYPNLKVVFVADEKKMDELSRRLAEVTVELINQGKININKLIKEKGERK